jgi:hypothetical protein
VNFVCAFDFVCAFEWARHSAPTTPQLILNFILSLSSLAHSLNNIELEIPQQLTAAEFFWLLL